MGKRSQSERTDLIKVRLNPNNDMTGQTFGEWFVAEYAGSKGGPWFKCQCSCGYIGIVRGIELRRGSMSCGHNGPTYKHGNKRRNGEVPEEYNVWVGMRTRCNDPQQESYHNYGGRGIKVCKRWDDFSVFMVDMGLRPSSKHTIERIDNNKGYEPSNCRWATRAEQVRNSRRTILFTLDGTTACLKDWCKSLGVSYSAAVWRIRNGWTVSEALFGKEN